MTCTMMDGDNTILSDVQLLPITTLTSTSWSALQTVLNRPGHHHLSVKATPLRRNPSLVEFAATIRIQGVTSEPRTHQGNFTFEWRERKCIQLKEGEFAQRHLRLINHDHNTGMITAVVRSLSKSLFDPLWTVFTYRLEFQQA